MYFTQGQKVVCTVDRSIKGIIKSFERNLAVILMSDGTLAHIPLADLKKARLERKA